jgi:hypothetical protein
MSKLPETMLDHEAYKQAMNIVKPVDAIVSCPHLVFKSAFFLKFEKLEISQSIERKRLLGNSVRNWRLP